jgi:hypothetical protein
MVLRVGVGRPSRRPHSMVTEATRRRSRPNHRGVRMGPPLRVAATGKQRQAADPRQTSHKFKTATRHLMRSCGCSMSTPVASVGTKPAPPRRAIHVPYRVNVGIERTTTVTVAPPMSWSSSPDQQERIPRMCRKDEVQAMSALGSACGRRSPSPTVLGRPAPDDQHSTQAAHSGSSRLKSEWARPGRLRVW